MNKNKKRCPICNKDLIFRALYWCSKCMRWFEEIDFLDLSINETNDGCKICEYLSQTDYKKNDLPLFYCNNLKTDRLMEKIRDFRKCKEIKLKGRE